MTLKVAELVEDILKRPQELNQAIFFAMLDAAACGRYEC